MQTNVPMQQGPDKKKLLDTIKALMLRKHAKSAIFFCLLLITYLWMQGYSLVIFAMPELGESHFGEPTIAVIWSLSTAK